MAVNRYAGPCNQCGNTVPAQGGTLVSVPGRRGRVPVHLACAEQGRPQVIQWESAQSGRRWTRNVNGTCEDAPCCGCCTA